MSALSRNPDFGPAAPVGNRHRRPSPRGIQDESISPQEEELFPLRRWDGIGASLGALTKDIAVQFGDEEQIHQMSEECCCQEEVPSWTEAPPELMEIIMGYLSAKDIGSCAQTCKNWKQLLDLDSVWKGVFARDFEVSSRPRMRVIQNDKKFVSWREEYKRLWCEVPAIQVQLIRDHRDEVLHVSFSNDGSMFATCSKDDFVKCWDAQAFPVRRRFQENMKEHGWKYTQWSAFNSSNTLLLVSGVHFGPISTSGELFVFNLEDGFTVQCKVRNKPYDIFGSWLDDQHLFSGNLHWTGAMESCCSLWINTASQHLESERVGVMRRAYKFQNVNGSSLRTLVVARPYGPDDETVLLVFSTGSLTFIPHQIGIKKLKQSEIPFPGAPAHRTLQEALAEHEQQLLEAAAGGQVPDIQYDSIDHILDLDAQIIGLSLSPDQRYLFANCRRWPENAVIADPFQPPPISSEIEIRCFDLQTMEQVPHTYRAHRAYTPSEECFFIFVGVSEDYVASGAENSKGYIWDRKHNITLSSLTHQSVVNCVAFNPADQQQLVTVSDDYTIRVWFSRSKCRQMGLTYVGQKACGVNKSVQCRMDRLETKLETDFLPFFLPDGAFAEEV
ncbi:F-box/WD repeat-containing protein 5 [Hypsibius exemplaris]|uniref:F-box/WD repeat-containing protein 5 n=1 Tax=Hypsibius exemplaris TaxID=2072580 RepID=A0A1W0WQT6_HYPEX|nr:F-box/WD repeat-containing protein 5 [Hypsibius exemplaris]